MDGYKNTIQQSKQEKKKTKKTHTLEMMSVALPFILEINKNYRC